jgi:hypothetical protein
MFKALCWLPLCGFTLLLAPSLFGQAEGSESALRLGVQTCDTQCQSTETDCDLACDQVVACVEECKKASEVCVQKCHDAPPPTNNPDGPSKPPIVAQKRKPSDAKKPTTPAKAPPKATPKAPAK